MTAERTALESALIPVTAYILDLGHRVLPPLPGADDRDRRGEVAGGDRRGGSAAGQPDRRGAPLVDREHPARRPPDPGAVRDDRPRGRPRHASARSSTSGSPPPRAFRGRRSPAGVGRRLRRPALRAGRRSPSSSAARTPIADDATRASLSKLNAALTSYLFLLYFDTRAGYQDTGPYPLPDGRTLLVRDFNEMARLALPVERGDRAPTSRTRTSRVALVLEGVDVKVQRLGDHGHRPGRLPERTSSRPAFFDSTGGTLDPDPGRASSTTSARR